MILEATHFLKNRETYTKCKYRVVEVFDPDDNRIRFNGFAKIDQSEQRTLNMLFTQSPYYDLSQNIVVSKFSIYF